MSPPTLSVLVTLYNREDYIADTLNAVLKSQFEDFELIVVDDQSCDDSLAITRSLAATDPRLRVEVNRENLGDYGNRMRAAALARGTFLKYVDSDDLIYPHSLQVMVDAMRQYPDAALGLAHSMPEDDQPYPWRLEPCDAYRKHFLQRGCLSCGPTGAIIRRDAFEASGGFRKQWGVLSDTDLWFRLAAKYPVLLLPPGLVWWRRHEDQEYRKCDAAEVYLQRGHELDLLALQDESCPLNESQAAQAVSRRKQHYARRLLSLGLRNRKIGMAVRLMRRSDLSIIDLVRGFKGYRS